MGFSKGSQMIISNKTEYRSNDQWMRCTCWTWKELQNPSVAALFWIKFPTVGSKTPLKCPGYTLGEDNKFFFGIDWYIMNLTSINMRKIGQCDLMLISLSVIAFLGDSMSNYFFVTTFSNSTLYFACRFDELCSSGASILEVSNLTYWSYFINIEII